MCALIMGNKRLHCCTRCSYTTVSSQKIQFHIHANKSSDIVYCHSCDFSACTPLILAHHRRLKHDERPNRKQCFQPTITLAKPRAAVTKPIRFGVVRSRYGVITPRFGVTKPRNEFSNPRIAIAKPMMAVTQPKVAITNPRMITPEKPEADVFALNNSNDKGEEILGLKCDSIPNRSSKMSFGTAAVTLNSIGDWINEEKPFKCCYCPYRSNSMGHVQVHIRTHQNQKELAHNPKSSELEGENSESEMEHSEGGNSELERENSVTEEKNSEFAAGNFRDPFSESSSESVEEISPVSDKDYSSSDEFHLKNSQALYNTSAENMGAVHYPQDKNLQVNYNNSRIMQDPLEMQRSHEAMLSQNDTRGIFSCSYCSYTNPKRHRIRDHERVHTGERPFACGHCDYTTSWSSSLTQHVKRHLGEKSRLENVELTRERKYPCSYCSHRSFTKQHLQRHEASHLKKALTPLRVKMLPEPHVIRERNFACSFCTGRYYTKQHLRRHEADVHFSTYARSKVTRNVQTKTSQFSFEIAGTGNQQERERPFACSFCVHRSYRRQDLRKHELMHMGRPS